ncbi:MULTISPECIES: multiple monosaccharide ABC transporter permease [unclassified Agarivorans]|uniref:multiple monosaccharide ABC transporter permease n=1 Tax=unclassified Agarivorans TaxID=2636026 RepID=UPI003D7D7073
MSTKVVNNAKDSDNSVSGFGAVTRHLREYGILLALIVIMGFFQIITEGTLLKPVNLTNLFLQNSYIIIMALGMLLVIVAGHIDLSVGSVCGFVGALAAVLMVNFDFNWFVTVIICLAAGFVIGAMQGYWIAYHKIPAFIVTLAGMLVFKGLTIALLQGQSVGPFPSEFQALSSGFIGDIFDMHKFNLTSFILGIILVSAFIGFNLRSRLKQQQLMPSEEPTNVFLLRIGFISAALLYLVYLLSTYKGIPNILMVMALLISLYVFITNNTTIGRRIYAIGGNEKAALMSGINTKKITFLTFANMGMLAALAGLVFAARLNTATPKAGLSFELDVIAAVFIGGASVHGGVGKIMGAVIGAFIMGVMNNGMSIMGVGIDWQQVIKGLVLLAAVIFDVYSKKRSA